MRIYCIFIILQILLERIVYLIILLQLHGFKAYNISNEI